jgi:hypothetical protein
MRRRANFDWWNAAAVRSRRMSRRNDFTPNLESVDALAHLFEDFDFHVEPDDFLIYELSGLIDADRATFEDEAFRRVIDEGIREHIEEQLETRARMAAVLRRTFRQLDDSAQRIAARTIRALEEVGFPLHNASLVVRTYTAYMFRRLQDASDQDSNFEDEARTLIERWHKGEILREEMTKRLKQIGRPAVGPLADLLFDAPEDRMAAETAIDTLGAIQCSSSARVLAHSIVEPILEEDLELKAYRFARALWPLPRHYILYTLATHAHEDLPFHWFQLLVDCDELAAVDMILDEVLVHIDNPVYHEDLKALLELLHLSNDPDVEEKVVALLNTEDTAAEAKKLLEGFVATFQPSFRNAKNPWADAAKLFDFNKRYLAAAKLYDSGRTADALTALNAILADDPQYPFAVALKELLLRIKEG